MAHFTHDNTNGYDDADLALLNRAYASLPVTVTDEDETIDSKSVCDYCAEQLLFAYDQGKRGDALVAWYYAP
ncbi:MAG TPA: hypothetical protein VGH84_13040 [Steroidobacteraceae bacterium]